MARDEQGALQLAGAVLDRQAGRGVPDRGAPRRATRDGLRTVVRPAGAAPRRSARAPRRGDPSSPPSAVVRAGHRSFTHDRSHVRAGRPARGGPYPVDTDRLRHGARDRGPTRVFFLDHTYSNEIGSLTPTEMDRTLTLIDHGSATPCDERGIPVPKVPTQKHVPPSTPLPVKLPGIETGTEMQLTCGNTGLALLPGDLAACGMATSRWWMGGMMIEARYQYTRRWALRSPFAATVATLRS